jgi:TatD DNase family protein
MIDSHAHLNFKDYRNDRADVIARAVECGVTGIVNIGFDLASSKESVALADEYPLIQPAVGVHPHDAKGYDDAVETSLLALLDHPKVIAVGETGLDFYRDLSPRDVQEAAFRRQLRLAKKKEMPVIIQCRDAFDDVVRVLEDEGPFRGIFHAFSGTPEMANHVLKLGFHLGIGGVVTFKNSTLASTIAEVPPNAIVLETDCPYLAPVPYRGKRNEPAYLTYVVETIAKAQGVTPEDVVRTTTTNFTRSLGLDGGYEPVVVYKIRNSLYINMTNRCTNRCVFCTRSSEPVVRGYHLGLDCDPSVKDIIDAAGDVSPYDEVVFCGYGEPLLRLDELITVSHKLKSKVKRLRLNTNGLGNLIYARNIVTDLAGLIDVISVSLNTADPNQYLEICRPTFGEKSYPSVLDFVRKCVAAGVKTICTAVPYPGVDMEACKQLAESLGAEFRARQYNVTG